MKLITNLKNNSSTPHSQEEKILFLSKNKKKIDDLLINIDNILNEIKNIDLMNNHKILQIHFKKVIPKTKEFYNLFSDNINGNKFMELFNIKTNITSENKFFEYVILDKSDFINRLSDIKKLINFVKKENMFDKEFIEDKSKNKIIKTLKLKSFNKTSVSISSFKYIDEFKELILVDKYSNGENNIESVDELYFNELDFSLLEKNYSSKKIFTYIKNNQSSSKGRIGILDSKITEEFLKLNQIHEGLIEYKNFVDDEEKYLPFYDKSHAEAVSTIAMFGDFINNHKDENGIIPVTICSVLSKETKTSASTVLIRIQKAINNYPKIKIWVLSLGVKEWNPTNNVSYFGRELDKIALDKDIRFVVSGGNDEERSGKKYVTPPSDAEFAITVNSLKSFDGDIASYTRRGYYNLLGNKPTFAYFGGDKNGTKVKVLSNEIIDETEGTSFAAPFIARNYFSIYYSLPEKNHFFTLSIMVNAALKNTSFNEFNFLNEKNYYGAGKFPTTLKKLKSSLRCLYKIEFNDKKYNNSIENVIALPKIKGVIDYKIIISTIDDPTNEYKYGIDHLLSSSETNVKFSINDKKISKSTSVVDEQQILLKPFTESKSYEKEDKRILNGKWKRMYAIKYDLGKYSKTFFLDKEKINENKFDNLNINIRYNSRYNNDKNPLTVYLVVDYEFNSPISIEERKEFEEELISIHLKHNHKIEEIEIELPSLEEELPELSL